MSGRSAGMSRIWVSRIADDVRFVCETEQQHNSAAEKQTEHLSELCPSCPDSPDNALTSDLSENTGFMEDFQGCQGVRANICRHPVESIHETLPRYFRYNSSTIKTKIQAESRKFLPPNLSPNDEKAVASSCRRGFRRLPHPLLLHTGNVYRSQ